MHVLVGAGAQNLTLPSPNLNPPPGTYSSPVKLDLKAPDGASLRYRFLESSSTQAFSWSQPLILDAMPGETRIYSLRLTTDFASGETVTQDYIYKIVPPAEAIPVVRPAPGFFSAAVNVQASLPPGWTVNLAGQPVSFPLILDTLAGDRNSFQLQAVGPHGAVLAWDYTIDKRDQESLSLEILSPQPGTWANAQPLVVGFKGIDQIFWSYGNHLDQASALPYRGPLVLDKGGEQIVTVAGRSRKDGRWVEKSVTWTNGTGQTSVAGWPSSGAVSQGLDFPALSGWLTSWNEGRSWNPQPQPIHEDSSSTTTKILAVELKKDGVVSRYAYWIDARPPQVPQLAFFGGWNPLMTFSGSVEAVHRVTWVHFDGTTTAEPTLLWGPTGFWKVPDQVIGARVEVQGINGLMGPAANISFARTGWSTPEWVSWDQKGASIDAGLPVGLRILPRSGFWPVYEIGSTQTVVEPGAGSPLLDGGFVPGVPWGTDRTFFVRFAWRDASGLVGPATKALAIRVDRVPPLAPEVTVTGEKIVVKPAAGEKDGVSFFWAVTPDRTASPETLNFQPYTTPLDVDAFVGSGKKVWFHAVAQDKNGNSGPYRLNLALSPSVPEIASQVVQVDPDPTVGDAVVGNGGVYSWPRLRLRPLDQDSDTWVGVAENTLAVPSAWKAILQPWKGILERDVGKGDRRNFLIFWNVRSNGGWAWTQPKTLSFTVDQGTPAPPILIGSWPLSPQAGPWTLNLKPGQTGDRLFYTVATGGEVPSDPVTTGEPWPGSRTWDAPAGGQTVVRVRVAAISVSGLSVEIPQPQPVIIDRAPPPFVNPALAPMTYQTDSLLVPPPSLALPIHYTLSSDGSLPAIPGVDSPVVPAAGLRLEGKDGQSVLYRLRWRAFSVAGTPGQTTDPYTILIDRTQASSVASPGPTPAEAPSIPAPTGLPPSGTSAVPVSLSLQWPYGILRYEVREGLGPVRAVTTQSPVWDNTLVLDSGVGLDRSYVVSLRGFSTNGRPMTPETQYSVRIDRQIPEAPHITMVADPRRPEVVLKNLTPGQNPEEVFNYRWSWDAFPSGEGKVEWTPLATDSVRFIAPDGALTHLHVEAFLRDEAGNQSATVEQNIIVDQNVVYAAPQGTGDGTRELPLGSVAQAVDKMRREGKAILFLGTGSLPYNKTLDFEGFQVFGGWDATLWEKTAKPGRSVLQAAAGFTGASLLESGDRPWSMTRIDVSASGSALPRLAIIRGSRVTLKDSSWSVAGCEMGWDQTGGTLSANNLAVTYAAAPKGSLFLLDTVDVSFHGLSIAESLNHDGILLDFRHCDALVQNLSVESQKGSGFESVWAALGSRLTVDGAKISVGNGADRVTAFSFKESEVTIWNSEISLYGRLSNTGFQTAGGRLELQKANLSILLGEEFNQGLVLDHGVTALRTVSLKVAAGAYQGGLTVDGGTLAFASGNVELAGGGKRVWGAQFQDLCTVNLEDVTWRLLSKTPGDLWLLEKPWSPASTVVRTLSTGW